MVCRVMPSGMSLRTEGSKFLMPLIMLSVEAVPVFSMLINTA